MSVFKKHSVHRVVQVVHGGHQLASDVSMEFRPQGNENTIMQYFVFLFMVVGTSKLFFGEMLKLVWGYFYKCCSRIFAPISDGSHHPRYHENTSCKVINN